MQKVLWFSSHLLAVLVHIGLVIVSIYGFIECGFSSVSGSGRSNQTERCTDEPKNTIVPWASFGMVSTRECKKRNTWSARGAPTNLLR